MSGRAYLEALGPILQPARALRNEPDSLFDDVPDERLIAEYVRPEVVTLCGSTRFKDGFMAETRRLTLEGIIVISVGLFGWDEGRPEDVLGEAAKAMLDELHKRKIDLADRIHVINRDGYVGSSTRGEIEYATANGKAITYMEPLRIDGVACDDPLAGASE